MFVTITACPSSLLNVTFPTSLPFALTDTVPLVTGIPVTASVIYASSVTLPATLSTTLAVIELSRLSNVTS